MRGLYCDCEIVLATDPPSSTAAASLPQTDSLTLPSADRLLGHRTVLAQASYFAMLFARADPDRIDLGQIDGERTLRAVYVVRAPFSPGVIAFLVDRLYGVQDRGLYRDPVEAVGAALFLGMPGTCAHDLVVDTLRALSDDLAAQESSGRPDAVAAARRQIVCFVAHMIDTDIPPEAKAALVARFSYLAPLSPSSPSHCVDRHGIGAMRHYRPEALTGDATLAIDDDGRRWRALRVSTDAVGAGVDRVDADGLVFRVSLVFRRASDGSDDVVLRLWCAPAAETLAVWPWGERQPDGMVEPRPRAMRARVRLYHPVRGIVDTRLASWNSAATHAASRHRQYRSYVATAGAKPPAGAVLVPNGLERASQGRAGPATRVARSATIVDGADPRDRSLWACEVDIDVEEEGPIEPPTAPS